MTSPRNYVTKYFKKLAIDRGGKTKRLFRIQYSQYEFNFGHNEFEMILKKKLICAVPENNLFRIDVIRKFNFLIFLNAFESDFECLKKIDFF